MARKMWLFRGHFLVKPSPDLDGSEEKGLYCVECDMRVFFFFMACWGLVHLDLVMICLLLFSFLSVPCVGVR